MTDTPPPELSVVCRLSRYPVRSCTCLCVGTVDFRGHQNRAGKRQKQKEQNPQKPTRFFCYSSVSWSFRLLTRTRVERNNKAWRFSKNSLWEMGGWGAWYQKFFSRRIPVSARNFLCANVRAPAFSPKTTLFSCAVICSLAYLSSPIERSFKRREAASQSFCAHHLWKMHSPRTSHAQLRTNHGGVMTLKRILRDK